MKKPFPITYVWRQVQLEYDCNVFGMAMVPLPRFHNYAASLFGPEGSEHTLEPSSMRSLASHRHYYAALNEAYINLPDEEASKYPSLEHFRKRLLVAANYSEDRHIVCKNHDQAIIAAAFLRDLDAYAIISVSEEVVIVRRAKSQDLASMNKEDFEASKKAVLELASSMIAVPVGELKRNAGRSA